MYMKDWAVEFVMLPKLVYKMSIYLKNNIVDGIGKIFKIID
jgi:hypothetical protein